MKKVHINEDAKIVSILNSDLSEFYNEDEEKFVQKVSSKLEELTQGLLDLQEFIENNQWQVMSERGEMEIDTIKHTLHKMIEYDF